MATAFTERIVFLASAGLAEGVRAAADAEETTPSEWIRRAIRGRLQQARPTTAGASENRPIAS